MERPGEQVIANRASASRLVVKNQPAPAPSTDEKEKQLGYAHREVVCGIAVGRGACPRPSFAPCGPNCSTTGGDKPRTLPRNGYGCLLHYFWSDCNRFGYQMLPEPVSTFGFVFYTHPRSSSKANCIYYGTRARNEIRFRYTFSAVQPGRLGPEFYAPERRIHGHHDDAHPSL